MPATITKRRFNVHEYHRMAEAGILTPRDRVQLIDGEVVVMSAVGSPHAATVARLTRLFSKACEAQIVWVQNPIRLDEWSEPEPDLGILRPKDDFYASAHPTPQDGLLVVEVSHTTLRFDREVKLPLYAAAGITEYWIIDLNAERIEVYREPRGQGYDLVQRLARGQAISPAALPDVVIKVDDILP